MEDFQDLRTYTAKFAAKLATLLPEVKQTPQRLEVQVSWLLSSEGNPDKQQQKELLLNQCPQQTIALQHRKNATQVNALTPLPELLRSLPESSCAEAGLSEVLDYVKKSQYLVLPLEWKGLL